MRQERQKVTIRLTNDEFEKLQIDASTAGQSLTGFATNLIVGRRQSADPVLASSGEVLAAAYALYSLADKPYDGDRLRAAARTHALQAIAILRRSARL
ncbi:MAG: hypothetical protein J0I80_06690 [Sphingomonas sp.]|nr:hypothetical protein [Sphingomonas sp.]